MKTSWVLIPVLLATAGCATVGGVPGDPQSDSSFSVPASPDPAPAMSAPVQQESFGPRLVQSAAGGLPALAIPLGGSLYQPVTGGLPVIGIPLTP
jgi:hypothetical protein